MNSYLRKQIIETERSHLHYGLSSLALKSNLVLARGEGIWLDDIDGKRYMDLFAGAGIASLGHSHKRFVDEVTSQLNRLIVGSYTTANRAEYLSKLLGMMPENLSQINFFSTGSEANEAALRIARSYTKRQEIISFWGGYHGKTLGTIGLTDLQFRGKSNVHQVGILRVPYPDTYRRLVPIHDLSQYRDWCIDFIRNTVKRSSNDTIAAIIVEPIQGSSGNVLPVAGFLNQLRSFCDEIGALLIFDEVITGFGRVGTLFAFLQENIVPDILVLGKGMANGVPVSAVITSEKIASAKPTSLPSGTSSSFGGNPLSIAAAKTTLEVIVEEKLTENSQKVGDYWLGLLIKELTRFDFVGDIRGRGLMIGIDLVSDRQTKEPLGREATEYLFYKSIQAGLIGGFHSPHVRINPPLIFTEQDADIATERMISCFEQLNDKIRRIIS